MSSHHRPARRRPAARPVSTGSSAVEAGAAQSAAQPSGMHLELPDAMPAPAVAVAPRNPLQVWLRGHAGRLTALIDRAEQVARGRLDKLEQRQRRGEEVYPREFDQVCRGLQLLARCGYELSRLVHASLKAEAAMARAEQAEARLQARGAQRSIDHKIARLEQLVQQLPQE